MTRASHTPGPWTWTTDRAGPEDEYGCATRGSINMDTFKSTGYGSNPELYAGEVCILSAGGGEYNPVRTSAADARLIAAAPELLDALKRCRDECDLWGDVLEVVEALVARVEALDAPST